ncbi:MAG: hypothetical protein WBI04_11715 [Trichlorobacter sp.]|jgi:hypothetical protein
MARLVSEHHLLFQLPLNASQDVDRLIFFYGLEAFGVVGPFLGSRRPMFTRQAFYPFAELPKALYLFVPLERYHQSSAEKLRCYLLEHADAYLFTWNQQHPESRLNARGVAPMYEEEREGRYIHCDAGHTWVHDPLRCNMSQKAEQGPFECTTEEISSGHSQFELYFDDYERSATALSNNWAIANDSFNLLPNSPNEQNVRMVDKRFYPTKDAAQAHADWLLNHVLKDYNKHDNAIHNNETYIYEPVRMDRSQVLTYREVRRLEDDLLGMAHKVEGLGVERFMKDLKAQKLFVSLGRYIQERPPEVVWADSLYPELPMAYFIAGLNGDRPYAQALGYYQVLEFAARQVDDQANSLDIDNQVCCPHCHEEIPPMNNYKIKTSKDEKMLKNLLEDKQRLPDSVLKTIYSVAIADDADALKFRKSSGCFDRHGIAKKIYKHLRNPTVHAGESKGTATDSVHPYSLEQFTLMFQQTVRLTRELARHFVGLSQPTR